MKDMPLETYAGSIHSSDKDSIADAAGHVATCESVEWADFLVKAGNAHDDLVAALNRATLMLEDIASQSPENAADWVRTAHRGHCPWQTHIDEARAALAKAGAA